MTRPLTRPKEDLTITVKVEFSPLVIQHQQDETLLHAVQQVLAGQRRIVSKMDTLDQALELLTTSVGDLDESIQSEIAELEALRQQQGGKLTDEQKARLTVLLNTIQAQKAALDADNQPVP